MEEERGKEKGGHKVTNPNKSNEIHKEESPAMKAKSCKGFVYDSSTLKSKSRNPLCIGIPCSLPCGECSHSPLLHVFGSERQFSGRSREARRIANLSFRQRITAVDPGPARVQNKEDAHVFQPHRTHKPTHSAGDEFLSRFSRNANVVAMGVAKNLRRVGNKIKDCLDDILYPYRRRPK